MQPANIDNRFSQFPGAQGGTAGFPGLQGLQSLQGGGFNMNNPMARGPGGVPGMPGAPGQQPGLATQQRLPTGAGLPSGMQQLGQRVAVPGQQFPSGVPGMNGMPGVRTNVAPQQFPGLAAAQNLQQQRPQAAGGMAGAQQQQQQQGMNQVNLAAQLQQRGGAQPGGVALGGLGGRLGNFGSLGGAGGGAGYPPPSGDLLSMLNKASGQQQPGAGGRQDEGPPAFNPADFPTLSATGGGQQGAAASGETFAALLNNQPLGGTGQQGPAFGEEDFPALPGADNVGGVQRQDGMEGAAQLQQLQQQLGALGVGGDPNIAALRMQQQQQQQQGAKAMQQPGAGQPERYGLLGLLSVIRMTDPDLTTLALGTDLTTLGLNLNSPEPLWKTFSSPWADGPNAGEPDFKIPSCYLIPPPRLSPANFSRFQPDTLFYIFYGMPNDEAQLAAAEELANRGWYYHKEFKAWLTRAPDSESSQKTDRFERGAFLVFDPNHWHVVRKDDLVVEFEKLERPIQLPKQAGPPAGAAPNAGVPPGQAQRPAGVATAVGPAS